MSNPPSITWVRLTAPDIARPLSGQEEGRGRNGGFIIRQIELCLWEGRIDLTAWSRNQCHGAPINLSLTAEDAENLIAVLQEILNAPLPTTRSVSLGWRRAEMGSSLGPLEGISNNAY